MKEREMGRESKRKDKMKERSRKWRAGKFFEEYHFIIILLS